MAEHTELSVIVSRLERVERENRRLRRTGLVVTLLAGTVLLMGQAGQKRTVKADVVEAQWFTLKDAQGKTRAQLGVVSDNAILTLYGTQGGKEKGIALEVGAGPTGPFVWLLDSRMATRARLELNGGNPLLTFVGPNEKPHVWLTAGDEGAALILSDSDAKWVTSLLGGRAGVRLRVEDGDGYRTDIGATELETPRTGETHKTSAASITVFGKDGKVLWSAP